MSTVKFPGKILSFFHETAGMGPFLTLRLLMFEQKEVRKLDSTAELTLAETIVA